MPTRERDDEQSKNIAIRSGETVQLAELSDRCFAKLIDSAIILVGAVIFFLVVVYVFWDFQAAGAPVESDSYREDITLVGVLLLALLSLEVFLPALSGKTLGKIVAGTRIVRFKDAQVPGVIRSLVRWATPVIAGTAGILAVMASTTALESDTVQQGLSAREQLLLAGGVLPWLLVYLSSLWDKNRRGWHDKLAGTVVLTGGEVARVEPQRPHRSPPCDGQDPTNRPSGSAKPETAVQGEEPSYGLVRDYYTPTRSPQPPGGDDTAVGGENDRI